MRNAVIIGAVVVLLGSGYYFYRHQIEKLSDMKYDFLTIKLLNFSNEKADLAITLRVTSSAQLEAEITELNLNVFIDNIKVGNIIEQKPIIIPAKGSSVVDLKVSIPLTNFATNVLGLATSYFKEKNATVKIDGKAKVKSAFIKTSVPFVYESSLKQIIS